MSWELGEATYLPASVSNRRTASALSASDNGNPAIISKAAAKSVSPGAFSTVLRFAGTTVGATGFFHRCNS